MNYNQMFNHPDGPFNGYDRYFEIIATSKLDGISYIMETIPAFEKIILSKEWVKLFWIIGYWKIDAEYNSNRVKAAAEASKLFQNKQYSQVYIRKTPCFIYQRGKYEILWKNGDWL